MVIISPASQGCDEVGMDVLDRKGSGPQPGLQELFVKLESCGYYFHEAEGIFRTSTGLYCYFPEKTT